MSFSSLGLSKALLRAIDEKGYTTPFPIQTKAIPVILSGKDVIAAAQTGTGKTAGFALPLLQRLAQGPRVKSNHIRALVLAPTRELADQVGESLATYGKHLPLTFGVAYGGVKINPQMMQLRGGLDILVATPGRLLDLFRQGAVKFGQVETLILDEADRMLGMGFIEDIKNVMNLLPSKRQNLLFSATFSPEIRSLTKYLFRNPVVIEVNPRSSAAKGVKQWAIEVDKSRKPALLRYLLQKNSWEQVLVFTRTRKGANRLVQQLAGDGISSEAIHGDKSQENRNRVLADFKAKKIRILVATGIASRGLDINELAAVINFDLPQVAEDYIHSIGRTGRAGAKGVAISLVSADEVKLLSAIEALLGQTLIREVEKGFIPKHSVPLTRLAKARPKKTKTPTQKPAGSTVRAKAKTSPKNKKRYKRNDRRNQKS
ncbi:DEAD/DEAH box helicase [Desulfogranum marinum]|uniref:DEAD/DEAH box helicase n=1 Tax=Desulfogranum marinum TaxID=453220 RepID=UPI0019642B60|nr:DEAD/DEAH box helicase [Desulfogranum marinum]MBM9512477.1 DEAD/DEAH box helicase [Desulfogranum marinum]